jgi:hypothetical protein
VLSTCGAILPAIVEPLARDDASHVLLPVGSEDINVVSRDRIVLLLMIDGLIYYQVLHVFIIDLRV